ncbi:MAG: GIY-YIG nuclease family protein, partial [Saprospiraceae bacterium]|nr:GIY-YIG nuclease family protein [Saprospiraceae bacterium]
PMARKYAIIDIETTGGLLKRDKIIEIAIVIHDGGQIIERFETLLNPGRSVSRQISMLTGITNEMLVDAPPFYEVARQIVEKTEGCVFVAHNVRFDYTFIKRAFESLGYNYSRKQLCTVRLSRMITPQLRRHGLGPLCHYHGIDNSARHRAMGDALATVQLFEKLINLGGVDAIDEIINYGIKASRLPASISLEKLHSLPEACGVYYLHNEDNEVIYVGKSINIKKRIMQHFAENTAKANKLAQRVHDITYELTGSELVALLLEEHEIKRLQPDVNRQLRRKLFPFALYHFIDEDGYVHILAEKIKKNTPAGYQIIKEYPKLAYARGHLEGLIEEFQLCQHRCGNKTGVGHCFNFKIGQCHGACNGSEHSVQYNSRALEAIAYLQRTVKDDFFIIDAGREQTEKSVVMIEKGQVTGYGYVDSDAGVNNAAYLRDSIKEMQGSRDAQRIVHWYIKEKKMEKILRF